MARTAPTLLLALLLLAAPAAAFTGVGPRGSREASFAIADADGTESILEENVARFDLRVGEARDVRVDVRVEAGSHRGLFLDGPRGCQANAGPGAQTAAVHTVVLQMVCRDLEPGHHALRLRVHDGAAQGRIRAFGATVASQP